MKSSASGELRCASGCLSNSAVHEATGVPLRAQMRNSSSRFFSSDDQCAARTNTSTTRCTSAGLACSNSLRTSNAAWRVSAGSRPWVE